MTEITQADRDAAWPYANFHYLPDVQTHERWFAGYYDNLEQGHAIRAFARHRMEERQAIVAWLRECDPFDIYGYAIENGEHLR